MVACRHKCNFHAFIIVIKDRLLEAEKLLLPYHMFFFFFLFFCCCFFVVVVGFCFFFSKKNLADVYSALDNISL